MEILMRCLSIGRVQRLFCVVFALGLVCAGPVFGGKLIIRLHAAHKSDRPRTVTIRSSLPERITPADIIDDGGLNIRYDVKSDTYYVHESVELGPGETFQRDVVMKDIWVIDEEEIEALRKRAGVLGGELSGSKYSTDSDEERAKVESLIGEILGRQEESGITTVRAIDHIQAYEKNLKALQELKQSVGRMENLAMAAGVNPGDALIGDDRSAATPRRDVHFPKEYGEAKVRITVRNSSATRTREVPVRRDLPPEISVDDVISSDGLAVRYDSKTRTTYVFKDDVEVPPKGEVTFEVVINDKWNINGERMLFLQEKVNQLLVLTSGRENIEAVENTLKTALEALEDITKEVGPETLSPEYIAFYRRQADRLDDVERDLNRIDSALKPLDTKRGFDIPAPDKKTTWLIIYIILGFLALVSLLFFLRWYVRSS